MKLLEIRSHSAFRSTDDGRPKMTTDVEFYRVARDVRQSIYGGTLSDNLNLKQDFLWVKAIKRLVKEYGIVDDFANFVLRFDLGAPLPKDYKSIASIAKEISRRVLDLSTEAELDALIREKMTDGSYVEIDNLWKDKANTYIYHIRDIVSKATVEEGLRERIFRA